MKCLVGASLHTSTRLDRPLQRGDIIPQYLVETVITQMESSFYPINTRLCCTRVDVNGLGLVSVCNLIIKKVCTL